MTLEPVPQFSVCEMGIKPTVPALRGGGELHELSWLVENIVKMLYLLLQLWGGISIVGAPFPPQAVGPHLAWTPRREEDPRRKAWELFVPLLSSLGPQVGAPTRACREAGRKLVPWPRAPQQLPFLTQPYSWRWILPPGSHYGVQVLPQLQASSF